MMEEVFRIGLTEEEARALDEELERMLAEMRRANERISRRQGGIDRLKTETREIIARLKEHRRVEKSV